MSAEGRGHSLSPHGPRYVPSTCFTILFLPQFPGPAGSVYTASGPRGGVVIISGTGTMAQLITPEGGTSNCGGWGHMFGDEGSAYHIAATAIRRIFWALDGFSPEASQPIPDVSAAHALMLEYFGVSDKDGMLDVFYKAFEKARVAGFTRVLAGAAASGDAFSASVFAESGGLLGSMARTLAPQLRAARGGAPGDDVLGLDIVCVGECESRAMRVSRPSPLLRLTLTPLTLCASHIFRANVLPAALRTSLPAGSVWKSWELLRGGFIPAITAPFATCTGAGGEKEGAASGGRVASFRLLRLTQSSAVGAAWKGAREAGADLPLDFDANTEVLFAYP